MLHLQKHHMRTQNREPRNEEITRDAGRAQSGPFVCRSRQRSVRFGLLAHRHDVEVSKPGVICGALIVRYTEYGGRIQGV